MVEYWEVDSITPNPESKFEIGSFTKSLHTSYIQSSPGSGSKSLYNGRKLRRICLVLDCLTPNDFTNRTQNLVNLQHHVIREKKLSEREALSIFYNVVCVVYKLHEKNVIHRDLKLGNIVLNCR